MPSQVSIRSDASALPPSNSPVGKSSFNGLNSSSGIRNFLPVDLHQNDVKASLISDNKMIEDEWSVKPLKKDSFDSLEIIVLVKEAEARMFQSRADEAQREAESFKGMIGLKSEKLEEEYAEKLAKICMQETEDRRRKNFDELKTLENSHCDYYNMKVRMQAEIAGLLARMEATKQQWV